MSAKTYDGQTGKFLSTFATAMPSLPGTVMQSWIDNPKLLTRALGQALLPNGGIPPTQEFKVWKTIKAASYAFAEGYWSELVSVAERLGWDISANNSLLKRQVLAIELSGDRKWSLVRISPQKCGFLFPITYQEFFEHAIRCRLHICPQEAAIRLRVEYTDQPRGEELHMATSPGYRAWGICHDKASGGAMFGDEGGVRLNYPPTTNVSEYLQRICPPNEEWLFVKT